jgi:hypothetical protein
MNDLEIDSYITWQIRKRGITLYDMTGGEHIDPSPERVDLPVGQRARSNRFTTVPGEFRLCELLTDSGFDSDNPYANLSVPVRDLVRYWWNNIADHEAILDWVFDGIFTLYKDRMLPKEEEETAPDLTDALDEIMEVV